MNPAYRFSCLSLPPLSLWKLKTLMTTFFSVIIILALCVCSYAADNLTVKVTSSHKDLYLMLDCPDDHPVPYINGTSFKIGSDRLCYLSFAANCSFDSSGHPVNCSMGGCGKGSCTLENVPVATMIVFNHSTVRTTTAKGYNFGLHGDFQCEGCPSFSCEISLNACPDKLKKRDNSGLLVGCNPGVGLPSGQDCPAFGNYSDLPTSVTWPMSNPTLNIFVSVIL